MLQSTSITKIAPALVKAQRNMTAATKDASNPYFKSKYADLSAVIDACVPALNAEGIFVSQVVTSRARPDGSEIPTLETLFVHESGEFIGSQTDIVMKPNGNAQDYGSAVSYARRYGLQSLAGLKAADDDGNSAAGKTVGSNVVASKPVTKESVSEAITKTATTAVESVNAVVESAVPAANQFKNKRAKPVTAAKSTEDVF